MNHIVSSAAAPEHLNLLRDWLAAQWGEAELLDVPDVPSPLLALEGPKLVGGLAFSRFRNPLVDETGLWINALFVADAHRRRGIASLLIRGAQSEARRTGEQSLFALTDVDQLYLKLGWHRIATGSDGTVVGITLENFHPATATR
jgi:GNAT superfamily N-acetyltransferase